MLMIEGATITTLLKAHLVNTVINPAVTYGALFIKWHKKDLQKVQDLITRSMKRSMRLPISAGSAPVYVSRFCGGMGVKSLTHMVRIEAICTTQRLLNGNEHHHSFKVLQEHLQNHQGFANTSKSVFNLDSVSVAKKIGFRTFINRVTKHMRHYDLSIFVRYNHQYSTDKYDVERFFLSDQWNLAWYSIRSIFDTLKEDLTIDRLKIKWRVLFSKSKRISTRISDLSIERTLPYLHRCIDLGKNLEKKYFTKKKHCLTPTPLAMTLLNAGNGVFADESDTLTCDSDTMVVYTDGSKQENSTTGYGVHMDHITSASGALPKHYSVFMCELFAILKSLLSTPRNVTKLTIFTDSMSSIAAIHSVMQNETPWNVSRRLKTPGRSILQYIRTQMSLRQVTLEYVPAHAGIVGNEAADSLAKFACDEDITVNDKRILDHMNYCDRYSFVSQKSFIDGSLRNVLKLQMMKEAISEWSKLSVNGRHAVALSKKRSNHLFESLAGSEHTFRTMFKFRTNTLPTNRVMSKRNKEISDKCPLCDGEKESTEHVAIWCPEIRTRLDDLVDRVQRVLERHKKRDLHGYDLWFAPYKLTRAGKVFLHWVNKAEIEQGMFGCISDDQLELLSIRCSNAQKVLRKVQKMCFEHCATCWRDRCHRVHKL